MSWVGKRVSESSYTAIKTCNHIWYLLDSTPVVLQVFSAFITDDLKFSFIYYKGNCFTLTLTFIIVAIVTQYFALEITTGGPHEHRTTNPIRFHFHKPFPKTCTFRNPPMHPVVQLNSAAYKLRSDVQRAIDANAGAKRTHARAARGKSLGRSGGVGGLFYNPMMYRGSVEIRWRRRLIAGVKRNVRIIIYCADKFKASN